MSKQQESVTTIQMLCLYIIIHRKHQGQINLKFKVLQDLAEKERVKALSSIEEGLDPVIAEPVSDCRDINTTLSK